MTRENDFVDDEVVGHASDFLSVIPVTRANQLLGGLYCYLDEGFIARQYGGGVA